MRTHRIDEPHGIAGPHAAALPALLVMLACASVAPLAGCGGVPASAVTAAQPTPVRTAAATSGPATPAITASGLVATRDEMRLSFKVGGVVRTIAVEAGDSVHKGQKLAAIELAEIDAQAQQADAVAAKAQRDLERAERLYADQVVSLEQLQDLRTQAQVTRAAAASARYNLGYATITAPRDGVVLRKLVEERELVAAGAPVLIIGAQDRGYVVKTGLADREIVQLKLGDPAEIRMDAWPGRALPGTVSEISRSADERTGMFPVEIKVDSAPDPLASGLVAKVLIHPATSRAGTLTYVPIAALVEGNADRAFVFVVDGEHVRRQAVRIAFFAGESVALLEEPALAPGTRVVTEGALYLADGERIRVVAPA
jgi:RND family efflux transporter MFP subunit